MQAVPPEKWKRFYPSLDGESVLFCLCFFEFLVCVEFVGFLRGARLTCGSAGPRSLLCSRREEFFCQVLKKKKKEREERAERARRKQQRMCACVVQATRKS